MRGRRGASAVSTASAACSRSCCGTKGSRRRFIARDRLGVKPVYYAVLPDGHLIVGSELKSLLAHGALARDIDPLAVEEYFALGYVPEPRTIFTSAAKLPPGHSLTVQRGAPLPAAREYWDVQFTQSSALSADEASNELVERLRESVRLRMISEVPLGAFLSGGVDSSAVVAMMAGVSATPVNTCSISFSDAQYDESKYAQQVAQRYRTRHRVERVDSDDFDLIDLLARLYDEPYADSSAIPTYRVCELARKHVTVALSGDGGDESFAGYRRYRLHMIEERMRQPLPLALRRPVFGLLGRVYPKADWAPRVLRGKTTLQALARDSVQAYFQSVSILRDDMRSRLYSNTFKAELAGYNAIKVFERHAAKANQDDALSLVQYIDLKTYLVGDINTKVDRASMAHSLEVREPLMDHPLVEWLATLPSSFKLRVAKASGSLRMHWNLICHATCCIEQKWDSRCRWLHGFAGPCAHACALRRTAKELCTGMIFRSGCADRAGGSASIGRRDHSAPLWALLMFEAFLRGCE